MAPWEMARDNERGEELEANRKSGKRRWVGKSVVIAAKNFLFISIAEKVNWKVNF